MKKRVRALTILTSAVLLSAPLAVLHAAESPPTKPTVETRARIEAQRQKMAALPVPAGLVRRTLKVGEVEREFFIRIPESCKGKPSPVVFALHGGAAASGLAMHLKVDYTPAADREGFVVVYPSGTEGWNNGVAHKYTGGVNNSDDLGFFPRDVRHAHRGGRGRCAAHLRQRRQQRRRDDLQAAQ